ncbi:MAG TPA: L,D-transpeptidase [Pseudonocardia sp.]|jgi:hypothetical protein|nr:L,D-transpeptidase [Pseudonocardia sp.]
MAGGALALYGAAAGYAAIPAFASSGTLKGTPCSATARACVDLDHQTAWLAKDGQVTLGPIRIASGGKGEETPKGTFRVLSKDKNHTTDEFPLPNGQPAPMPNSVFFEPGGIAFHGGDPKRASAGCIHVPSPNDLVFFNTLNVGDEVQVVKTMSDKKGGFYKVNHLKPPSKKEVAARKARQEAARENAAAIKAAGRPGTQAAVASGQAGKAPSRHS